jgi:hypothetical protein
MTCKQREEKTEIKKEAKTLALGLLLTDSVPEKILSHPGPRDDHPGFITPNFI